MELQLTYGQAIDCLSATYFVLKHEIIAQPESRAESLETADKTVPVASKLGFFASLLHQPGLKSCLAVHLAVTFVRLHTLSGDIEY